MFFRRPIFFTFLILYELFQLNSAQEYLRELRAKDIKFNNDHDLPPVELPRPIYTTNPGRTGRTETFDNSEDVSENTARQLVSPKPSLMDIALEASAREGLKAMQKLYAIIEPEMIRNGHFLHDNHPGSLLSRFSAPEVESTRREMAAYATLTAAKVFRKNYSLNSDLARQAHRQKVSLRRTALESLCPPRDPPTCMPASERYRTHDGTCNNKRRQRWGASQMPFSRFLPPEYGDGVDSVRKSVDGGPLSSSRFVSLLVHGAREGEAPLTLMLAQWGQLLDHDMTSTAQPRSINGSVPSCCGNNDFHPSCFPIKVPLDDPWLSPLKVRCLEFLRSAPAQRRDCVLSWREQTNQATSYIDASPIYSNSVKSSDNARVFRNGLLVFGRGNPKEDVCQRGAIATNCIRAGDGRSGEQPGLLAMHHVWVGEHNHIATRLSEMNLHWSDEKIYQETRRIIGAMFQHITYREFLPIVLGREVVKLFELELLNSGYFEGYDPKTNPGVSNAFAAAAFRFGHSLVQNSYIRCDRFHNVLSNNVSLHEEFQRGDIGSVGSLHRLIRGLANQRSLKRDEFITPELTNHLFQTPGFPFGLDLAAINIQRGRDHGIPPYTHWRVPCGLSAINTWEEFAKVVGPESARRISHAYHNVHDIDLFVGGIAERPVVNGLVGPTFACIIAQQFSNSRKGDRFWYENGGFESSFTPAQLHSIRRVTLASVLCRTVGGGTFQPHIFLPPDMPQNQRLPCGVGSLSEFDLDPWLEQDPFLTPKPVQFELPTPAPPPIQIQTRRPVLPPLTAPPTAPTPPTTPVPPTPLTFAPPVLDRIFEIVQGELEANAPIPDSFISDNKVGFLNRKPGTTKHPIFISQRPIMSTSSNSNRIKNTTKINDKLDLKQKGTVGHVTKQKPLPGVDNKLDKNSRKGPHRQASGQTTTRRTIIVNNIPIELRNAGIGTTKLVGGKFEARTEDLKLTTNRLDKEVGVTSTVGKNIIGGEEKAEARTEDLHIKRTDLDGNEKVEARTRHQDIVDAALGATVTTEKLAVKDAFELKVRIEDQDMSETKLGTTSARSTNAEGDIVDLREDLNISVTEKQPSQPKTNDKRLDGNISGEENTNRRQNNTAKQQEVTVRPTNEGLLKLQELNKTETKELADSNLTQTPATERLETVIDITRGKHGQVYHEHRGSDQPKMPDIVQQLTNTNNSVKEPNLLTQKDHQKLSTMTDNKPINLQPSPSIFSNDSDIDPMANSPSVEHRRVQRTLKTPRTTNEQQPKGKRTKTTAPTTSTQQSKTKRTLITAQTTPGPQQKSKTKFATLIAVAKSNATIEILNKTLVTKPPKLIRTTLRNVELRQYQNRPSYNTKPHKVIVDSGTGENQYEIEINIRQTNKGPNLLQTTPDYHTNYNTKPYDRYALTTSTTPLYGYFQTVPTHISQTLPNNQRTKPPTIIFINEHDDFRTTTRQPGFIHSIVGWTSGGQRPLPANIFPPNIEAHNKPGYEGVLSRPVTSGAVLPPSYQNSRPGSVSSFSEAHLTGGVVQASSQAISNGQYGSISGFASAHGTDSTFSFNIRPKPDKTQNNHPGGGGNYDISQSPPNPWYLQKPGFDVRNPGYDVPHREGPPSPFSTSNSQTYYVRKKTRPQQKEDLTLYSNHELTDYDYLTGRRSPLQNITALEDEDTMNVGEEEEYEYDDDYGNTPLQRKFNKDGYLRPEHMIATLLKSSIETDNKTVNSTDTILDDNYVFPAMNSTKDIPKDFMNYSSDFPDSQSKQLNNDIFAEDLQQNEDLTDDDDDDDEDDDSVEKDKMDSLHELQQKTKNILKRHQEKIAFAPITILTKPERPDNWVLYDSPKEQEPLLPQIPDLKTDLSPSAEIPKPIRENIWLSLANIKRRIALRTSQTSKHLLPLGLGLDLSSKTLDKTNSTQTTVYNHTDVKSKSNPDSVTESLNQQSTTLGPNGKTIAVSNDIDSTTDTTTKTNIMT